MGALLDHLHFTSFPCTDLPVEVPLTYEFDRSVAVGLREDRLDLQAVAERLEGVNPIVKCNLHYISHLWLGTGTGAMISTFITWAANAQGLRVSL